MFYAIKIKKAGNLPAFLLALGTLVMLLLFAANLRVVETSAARGGRCLVIDPGHGGIDGGVVSTGGKKESDINLAIALRLQKAAEFWGINTVMTRVDDSMRTDAYTYSEHEDLVHRTEIINAAPEGALISIHQNCYPTTQPSGAQVLYAPSPGSRSFGELTHGNIIKLLQPENRRVAEPASKGLYITANVGRPAILVECGFMSNFSDIEKLCTESYQTAFAVVLLGSFLQFSSDSTIT